MGRRAEIEPRWLVSLLVRWAMRDTPGRELGYNSGSKWMMGLKSSPATAISDPTGFSAEDYSDAESGMVWLHDLSKPLWASVMMYYKPWTIQALQDLGYPFGAGNKTYYNRLHEGHWRLAQRLNEVKAQRAEIIQKLLAPESA